MKKTTSVILFFMLSCQSDIDPFYKVSHVEDIDVLPLIKPYRLWTPIPGSYEWHLDFLNKIRFERAKTAKVLYSKQINVCKINILRQIIFGHCKPGESIANYYFVVIPEKKIERAFEFESDWLAFLKENGIVKLDLFDVHTVYSSFEQNHKSLPWYDQIKKNK